MAESEVNKAEMQCIVLKGFGGYDKFNIETKQRPSITPRDLLVKVHACSLNFCDLYTRQGIFTLNNVKPPFVMGMECSGLVEEVGQDVADFKVGDRVMCWSFTYGLWAEYVAIPSTNCFRLPENMTYKEGAAFPISFMTAYFVLFDFGNLRPSQSVLVQSAAGSLGWAVTQLARTVDGVVVFGTASPEKHEILAANGLTFPIDYRNQDFVEEVTGIQPNGVDIVIDSLSGHDFIRTHKLLKPMGRLIHVGVSNMVAGERYSFLRALRVWWELKNISIFTLGLSSTGVCGFNLWLLHEKEPDRTKAALQSALQLWIDKKISLRIDSVWSFNEITEATKRMVDRANVGKIIIVPKKEDLDS